MRVATAVAAAALVALPSAAFHLADRVPSHARGGRLYADLSAARDAEITELQRRFPQWPGPSTSPLFKTSQTDNFNPGNPSTFQQRYYLDTSLCAVNSTCATTAPIIIMVGGEWTVSSSPTGAIVEVGAPLGAVLVYLEHRYYGASLPTPLSDKASMQAFLSVEQAIADTAAFIPFLEAQLGSSGKRNWLMVGGSYSGALVTWFTVKHAALINGTWASSGVVDAIFDFTSFDQTVANAIGQPCGDAVRAVTAAFESAWGGPQQVPLLNLFGSPVGFLTQQDFAWMLADSAAMGPQYGCVRACECRRGHETAHLLLCPPPRRFKDLMCSYLVYPNGSYATGWPALVNFAQWTSDHYGAGFGASCYYSTSCLTSNTSQWADSTTWVWQCCSQVRHRLAWRSRRRTSTPQRPTPMPCRWPTGRHPTPTACGPPSSPRTTSPGSACLHMASQSRPATSPHSTACTAARPPLLETRLSWRRRAPTTRGRRRVCRQVWGSTTPSTPPSAMAARTAGTCMPPTPRPITRR